MEKSHNSQSTSRIKAQIPQKIFPRDLCFVYILCKGKPCSPVVFPSSLGAFRKTVGEGILPILLITKIDGECVMM